MARTINVKRTMQKCLICIVLSIWFFHGSSVAQAQSDPTGDVIRLVDELRVSNGLPAYKVDAVLMSVAQAQASWSAANNHIGHDGPGGSSPDDRAQAAGYGGGERSFAVENTAHGTASINTPELVVTMWQTDWGHLSAMISPKYEHIGVGYAEAGGYSWYVMMVGWVGSPADSGDSGSQETSDGSVPYVPLILSEPDENGAIYHEVQLGQAAWTIAAYYEVNLDELLALNQLTEDSILHPGDVLVVRLPETSNNPPTAEPVVEIAVETPVVVTPIPSMSPTQSNSEFVESSPRSSTTPVVFVIGSGLILLAGFVLVRTWMART